MKIFKPLLIVCLMFVIVRCEDLEILITNAKIKIKTNKEIEYVNVNDTNAYIKIFKKILNEYEEEVRSGKKKEVFSTVKFSVEENINGEDFVNILYFTNEYSCRVLKNITVFGLGIKVINEIHYGNIKYWENSKLYNVGTRNKENIENEICTNNKIRINVVEKTKITDILDIIKKDICFEENIYQFCNDKKCLGMRGVY